MEQSSTPAQTPQNPSVYPSGRQCGSRDLGRQSLRRDLLIQLESPWPLPRVRHSLGRPERDVRRASAETGTTATAFSQPGRTITPFPMPLGTSGPGISAFSTSSRQTLAHTKYMSMLLALDRIPRLHNIIASLLTWILLAGFIISAGALNSIPKSSDDASTQNDSGSNLRLAAANSTPFIIVGVLFCSMGGLGMFCLALRWRHNYIWLLNKLYMPGILNGIAGLLSTLTIVYSQQRGDWGPSATVVAIVEASVTLTCMLLFFVYNNLLLNKVKEQHRDGLEIGIDEDGFLKKLERVTTDRSFAPGSIV
ncbi:uncharacterized protein E0L32_000034 [Thyridium curvatum]|uniref:Uncharacterized protein n=1 Tax=Thyridium curvatum TaxID=1093900 RepID=A0A507BGN2_9PEZI|nr:uncharacterized protein E0L32_000034 [Thyridium curvatum]TPX15700.1 hypothetical protein E0L32_000034 [Thyridium curvatum]